MFAVIIFVHAVGSGWTDTIEVNPKYPSFETCEAARPDLETSYKDFLERQRLEKIRIESKCVADKSARAGV
jgi:hypothetical protein